MEEDINPVKKSRTGLYILLVFLLIIATYFISYDYGVRRGTNTQKLSENDLTKICPWNRWTPAESNVFLVLNGDGEYKTGFHIVKNLTPDLYNLLDGYRKNIK